MSKPEVKRLQAGEIIFREGDPGNCAYIIEKGRVEIFMEGEEGNCHLSFLGVGEIFGEMAVIDGAARSASAQAADPSELVVVSQEQISERIDSADPIVRLLLTVLLKRIRVSNLSVKDPGNISIPKRETPGQIIVADESQQAKPPKEGGKESIPEQDVLQKMKLESELKSALEHKEFSLYFQPIIDMVSRKVMGFEALIRWESPSRGMVRPDIFMGLAEETSLIIPIGKWVIEHGAQRLAEFKKAIKETFTEEHQLFLTINISGRQFHDTHFLSHLTASVKAQGVSYSDIKLEVTEGIFLDGPAILRAIAKCREAGFPIALDDFGTGYSSLSYLAQFPVDTLKIDQSFIRKMTNDNRSLAITRAVIDMANGLSIPVVAEGIETEDIHRELTKMSCDLGQGYLYSKPLPFDKAKAYLLESLEKY